MAERDVSLRLAVVNAEEAIQRLRSFGEQGENALNRIKTASTPASAGLDALNASAVVAQRGMSLLSAAVAGFAGGLAVHLNPLNLFSNALSSGVRNSQEAEQAMLRLEGVFRATGGAAGITAKDIGLLAEQMERTRLVSSSAVTEAAAALATFKSVQGEIFTDALRAAQDLSAVFGGNIVGQATQLGKALEDPIQGLTALRRVGVSFSQDQRDVIRALVETGEVAQAQRLILEELATQVGGAGEREASGLAGAFHRAATGLGDLTQAMAEASGLTGYLAAQMNELGAAADRLGARIAPASALDELAEAVIKLEEAQARLARLESDELGYANTRVIDIARRQVEDLTEKVERLREAYKAEVEERREARKEGERQAEANAQEAEEARARAAAEEALAKQTRERERAAEAAARAAEQLAIRQRDAVETAAIEVEQQERLLSAQRQGEAAYKATAAAIETETALRSLQLDAMSKEGQALAELIRQKQVLSEELEREAKARREAAAEAKRQQDRLEGARREVEEQRRLVEARFESEEAHAAVARAIEIETALRQAGLHAMSEEGKELADLIRRRQDLTEAMRTHNRQQQEIRAAQDRIGAVVADLTPDIARLTAATLRDFRNGMLDSAEAFAERIGDILASIPEQLIGTAFTSLFDSVIQDFGNALKAAAGPGGALDFSALMGAFSNPLGAAALGAFGGGIAGQLFGFGNQYTSAIGGIGAGLGFMAGGPIGGLLGGLGGSLLSGLFGGSGSRDNVGLRVGVTDLFVDAGGTPNANTGRAQQIGQQLAGLITGLRAAGVEFDPSGQIRVNVNNSRSDNDVFRGALRQIIELGNATDPVISRVLATSGARTPEALLQDVQFAQLFQQLTGAITPAEQALREINIAFDEHARRARQLGLDERELAAARQRAMDELVRAAEDQVSGVANSISSLFAGRLGPLQGALDQFQFGPGSALGVQEQLGLARSEFDLLAARARAGEDIDFSRLAQLGTQVVGLAREFDASGSVFQETFRDIDAAIRELVADQTRRQDDMLSALPDAIRDAQRDQTLTLSRKLDELIAEYHKLTRAIELQGRVA